jgi:enediyne biosynthesis protein E4
MRFCECCGRLHAIFTVAFALILVVPTLGAPTFTDVTGISGIQVTHNSTYGGLFGSMSGGAAAADYDNDGWVDLYVTRIDAPDILYRNNGNGSFTDVTQTAFPTPNLNRRTNGAVWGDIDNDADLDLYVSSWGGPRNLLYVNDHGVFQERAVEQGAAINPGVRHTSTSPALGDYDSDGYLDLYVGEWNDRAATINHSRLLHNRGMAAPGFFDDVTEAAGVGIQGLSYVFAPRFTDLDRDGRVDLAIAADFGRSKLYWNNGNGSFTNGTEASGANQDASAMGSTIGDYDNDGDLDWFLGNIDVDGNNLYRNQLSQGLPRTFSDVAEPTGLIDSDWTWGSSFLDFDNDGNLDIVMTNGAPLDEGTDYRVDPMYLFRNKGASASEPFTFEDVSQASLIPRNHSMGSGLVVFDFDRDGDQDIFVVNGGQHQGSVLYRNDGGNDNAYLQIDVQGQQSNRDGLGAWIEVTADSERPNDVRVWEVNAGSNFLGQNEKTAHFGWGARTEPIDLVTIHWPSGIVQQFHDVPLNSRFTATELVPEPYGLPSLMLSLLATLQLARTTTRRNRHAISR